MQLWAGLGNPGAEHNMQRHNMGFMVADAIAELHGFAAVRPRFQGWTQEGRIGGGKILLLRPATFMNKSGQALGAAMRFFRLGPEDVTVFYDELDLEPFRIKVRRGGGTAGHNGIRSTAAHIGNDFRRIRIGIGHPGDKARVTRHVLGNYAKTEIEPLTDLLGAIATAAPWLARGDDARFLNEVALRLQG